MLSPINILIAFLWLISATVDYANFCYIWQLKEYRWDRFKDFLSTVEGHNYFLRYKLLWRSVIAIIIFFWPFNNILTLKYLIVALFSVDLVDTIYNFITKRLGRPRLTKKAILIIFLSLVLEGGLFLFKGDWITLLILLIVRFLILSVVVKLIKYPTMLVKKYYISKASKKIDLQQKHLTVIGVTGSYAKSTVKCFLSKVLSGKFKVLSTPKNINTEIGVAEFIINNPLDEIDILVVEMGAYKVGEIKEMANMVKPQIGILTAINTQHLSLFGSLENTQAAKYELLHSLPKTGLAIINADNPYCMEFLSELNCRVKTFGLGEENKPNLLIYETNTTDEGIRCLGKVDDILYELEAPIPGEYNALNIAPVVLAALELGLSKEEIKAQVSKLKLPDGVLNIYKYGNCTIIDDSANANPNGFKAVLDDVLHKMPSNKRRIVITRGMLELGEKSDEMHEKIGEEISFVADELIIITKDFIEPLRRGVIDKYKLEIKIIFDRYQLLEYVKSLKDTEAVILLENRIPSVVYKEIKG